MDPLPKEVKAISVIFADGRNGYARQVFENQEFRVRLTRERQGRGEPFIDTWTAECFPGKEFKTYNALRDAYNNQKEEVKCQNQEQSGNT